MFAFYLLLLAPAIVADLRDVRWLFALAGSVVCESLVPGQTAGWALCFSTRRHRDVLVHRRTGL